MTVRVRLHRFGLAVADAELASLADLLAADERERAARYRRVGDRDRFIVARARLRIVLGAACGTAPDRLRFAYGPHGKPSLPAHPALRFSLSHTDDAALVAIAHGAEVGVDWERTSRRGDFDAVAATFFSARERAALAAVDGAGRPLAILRCWCRKEAYLKARGDGLTRSLDAFDMAVGDVAPGASALLATRPDPSDAWAWYVRDLDVGADHAAALAIAYDGANAPVIDPHQPRLPVR